MNERYFDASPEDSAPSFLAGGGEMRARMRSHDWSTSPLGRLEAWPLSLRTTVSLMLASKFPMFVAWGPDLGFLYNDAYVRVLGSKHPDALGRPFEHIWGEIWSDLLPLVDKALAGEATWAENLPLVMNRHGHDEETYFTFSYSPVHDDAGQVAGIFCACTETTGQVLAERRLADESERMARMFEQAPGFMAMLRGPEHVFELTNAAYLQLVGHRDLVGKTVREALPEVVGQGFFDLLDRVYQTGEPFPGLAMSIQLQRMPGGRLEDRFVDFVYQPITDAAGNVTGIFVEGSDVTERKKGEDHLRLLINELNHRVKNSLSTVQAIAAQTFRNAGSLEQAKTEFSARLLALARAHDVLTDANWSGASLADVVRRTVEPHGGHDRFRIEGPHVLLTPKSALSLSMALHELCTNAAKYGALSVDPGRVDIVWAVDPEAGDRRLHMRWTEVGGPPVEPPMRTGFGSRLIEYGLAAELGGEVRIFYEPGGVVCVVDAPLPEA